MVILSELYHLLDLRAGPVQPLEDCLHVGPLLHGNKSELVLLVDPDQEGLIGVVEDAPAVGPVPVQADRLQEPVALLEQEVILYQLLFLGLAQVA